MCRISISPFSLCACGGGEREEQEGRGDVVAIHILN